MLLFDQVTQRQAVKRPRAQPTSRRSRLARLGGGRICFCSGTGRRRWIPRKATRSCTPTWLSRTRVQDPDGRWRTIDSASLYRSVVAFSDTYNFLLADEVTRRVGVGWKSRERGRGRRVAREIQGDGLTAAFSQSGPDEEAVSSGHGPLPRAASGSVRGTALLAHKPTRLVSW